MSVHDTVIRELSKEYGLDSRTINEIVKSPFRFARKLIESVEDARAVRIPYFGKYALKGRKTIEDKEEMLISKVISELKFEANKIHEDNAYKRGILRSIELMKEIISHRHGDPKKYGLVEEETV